MLHAMSKSDRRITPDDLMDLDAYGRIRKDKRAEMIAMKAHRRMEVGPYATFYFENYDTMWQQVQEMLYTERGGAEQIGDELGAYNPLIPQGRELVATMMLEIPDATRRAAVLAKLGGIEETVSMTIGNETIEAVAETDVDRTSAAGKASSVHFFHFPMTDDQAASFKSGDGEVMIAIDREGYQHRAVMPAAVRKALAADLD